MCRSLYRWQVAAAVVLLAVRSVSSAQVSAVLVPSDNTWLRRGVSRKPHGNSKKLLAGRGRVALLKFDLLSLLPAGTPVQRAVLQLVPLGRGPRPTVSVSPVLGPWDALTAS